MFKNKNKDGSLNLCGAKITRLRKREKLSQNALAKKLQLNGMDLDKNAIQRIECGRRFVTDMELKAFSNLFDVAMEDLVAEE